GADARAEQSWFGGEAIGGATARKSDQAAGAEYALLQDTADTGASDVPAGYAAGGAGGGKAEAAKQSGRSRCRRRDGHVARKYWCKQCVDAGADAGGGGPAAPR